MDEVEQSEPLPIVRSRRRVLVGAASVALAAGIAGLTALAAGASATTKSNSVSRTTPPNGQPPAVSGKVKSVNASGNTFTIQTRSGTTYTVDVSSSTTYRDPSITSPTLANVTLGEQVSVFGTTSSTTVTATDVLIGGPAPTVVGTVKSVDATSDSFTLSTRAGTTYTVDVSNSTTYSDPSVTSPTFANVTVGEQAAVFGTTSSTTVSATKVLIGPAGGGCIGGMADMGGPPDRAHFAPFAGGTPPSSTLPQR